MVQLGRDRLWIKFRLFLRSGRPTPDKPRTGQTSGPGIPHDVVNSGDQFEYKLQMGALSVLKLLGRQRGEGVLK